MSPETQLCHCGRPLHYTNEKIARVATDLVERLGEFMPVTVDGRTWLVQRHYIALHGITAATLPLLGFKEITDMATDSASARLSSVELFAWVGEDELGSGVIGLKQGLVPAGYIPLVSVDREKVDRGTLGIAMELQANSYGKKIYLCRFTFAEVVGQTVTGEPL